MKEKYFLAKWLANEISDTALKEYVSEDEIRIYQKIVSTSDQLEVPSFNAKRALEELKIKTPKTTVRKLYSSKFIYRAAAVIAIVFSSYYFIGNQTQNYTTSFAEKTTLNLPDNSVVNLNAASEISFKSSNWESDRSLSLNGEAYFKVAKGSKFTVKTSLGNVTVLGTQFNVVARANYFEVVCYEGLVSATYKENSVKIPAGSSFKVLNDKVKFEKAVNETKPTWIQNNSSFKSMPYWYVVNELERQYNVTVNFSETHESNLFTGSFTHNNIEIALKAITIPLNLNYTFVTDKEISLK